LNVALQGLPETCRRVVWIDCDVVFEADDWAERTNALLDRFMLVAAVQSPALDAARLGARPRSAARRGIALVGALSHRLGHGRRDLPGRIANRARAGLC
jgi:hypothetical protein